MCIWNLKIPSSATEMESLILDKILMTRVQRLLHSDDFRVKEQDLQPYEDLKHWLALKKHLLKSF